MEVLFQWNILAKPEEVGHVPHCIMVEAINQSGACIFLQVDLEEIVARVMKRISWRIFSALTSLVIQLLEGKEW